MYSNWSSTQPPNGQRYGTSQQPNNQGFFQFQQGFPFMMMQQQQQQGQFIGSGFPPFPPFPNNTYMDVQNVNNGPPNTNHMSREHGRNFFEQNSPYGVHYEGEDGPNRVSYERQPNQEQYASYPRDAVYRHASGPGWQRQEVSYPPRPYR